MGNMLGDEIKRWAAKRKAALVMEIIQGKSSISEASRAFNMAPRKFKSGLMKPNVAWRSRCGQSPWTLKLFSFKTIMHIFLAGSVG